MPEPGVSEFRGTERFQLLARLGEGGMGVVWRAFDREARTQVALKTMRQLSADAVLHFKNEFRALQDLQHPNLINLGELISEGGQWFFTMELIDGIDPRAWVRGRDDEAPDPERASPRTRTRPGRGDGRDEDPWVDRTARWDPRAHGFHEWRLRSALGQLAAGLHALHCAGKIHRDVKPSNVLVTTEGRVVLLDFGLASDAAQQADEVPPADAAGLGALESDPRAAGTADYMAPEQAALRPVGPPADWYAVGVLLYEMLTGRLPYPGSPLEVMLDKQQKPPPAPRTVAPEVPADLDALCMELLAIHPAARPSGAELVHRLGAAAAAGPVTLPHAPPFVGRRAELDRLRAALDETRRGRPRALFVLGESGLGKSALVQQFARQLAAAEPDALVLAGRCYERESVPYKAVDAAIDQLSRVLSRMRREEAAPFLPPHTALLAQVFPVLRRAAAVAESPPPRVPVIEPVELRTRVFGALRELLARLARTRPLVLAVDDLQWADADSLALLAGVLGPPDPPPLLLLATVRHGRGGGLPIELTALARAVGASELELERLSPVEARDLVGLLDAGAPAEARDAIAEEAGGHPLFIDELVRHLGSGAQRGPVAMLDDALWVRIGALDGPSRLLLELVAVAGVPTAQATLRAAAGEESFAAFQMQVSLLRAANLVRSSGVRATDTVEPYHDRVREAVLFHLEAPALADRHRELAVALETSRTADPEVLAVHWHGAGEGARGGDYAVQAAVQAVGALAFDRAARLYRFALSQLDEGARERRDLLVRLGEALANASRGAEASTAFLEAAAGAPASQALDLQRRAAEQLMRIGRIAQGLTVMRTVLAAVGIPLPSSPANAYRRLVPRRLQVALRGYRFRERDASQLAPGTLTRIDVCWSAALSLSMVDPVTGAYFQTRCLLDSLAAGEPVRVARAIALESAYTYTYRRGGGARRDALERSAFELARRTDRPYALGMVRGAAGVNRYLAADWPSAHRYCEEAAAIFRDHCTGVAWELHTAEAYSLLALSWMGEIGRLRTIIPLRIREAESRGDVYAVTNLRTLPTLANFCDDRPDEVSRAARAAAAAFAGDRFYLQSSWAAVTEVQAHLYQGEPAAALLTLDAVWPKLRAALILRLELIHLQLCSLRGGTAIAAAAREGGAKRRDLIRRALDDARTIEAAGTTWGRPLALVLRGQVEVLRGDPARGVVALGDAAVAFDAMHMPLFACAVRRQVGRVIGGDDGRRMVADAETWIGHHGAVRPDRLADVLTPPLDARGI